jgi:hypothetical protein
LGLDQGAVDGPVDLKKLPVDGIGQFEILPPGPLGAVSPASGGSPLASLILSICAGLKKRGMMPAARPESSSMRSL